ncbi:hypothetical protein [Mycobacterium sp. E2989]|uniref:hypothetical protein n=1 Tax=Mycobacterium sp. E2989 TaxID=1834140 RepID=UPI0007FFE22C|nr:hypothetical protein [Mycobacterium sp. E2989]OBH87245.1 hypothetical protein A5680_04035 [Mycobacterium sp. E2989]
MTTPPGGPYGQEPYGNPYGQQPYWGGPPQGGQYPGGQYPPPPTGPYYPPYPQPGQQFPPGYPPGPPPRGPGSKLPWLIIAGLVLLAVIALVATLIVMRGGNHGKPSTAAPSSSSTTTSSQPRGQQTASDCTPNVSGGEIPRTDSIAAGKLSFPASAVPPNWQLFSDDQNPNLIGAVGVAQEVPGASQWMMTAEVGVTNFVASMDVSAQASKLLQCIANGPGYANATPTLGRAKTSSITVDGTKAARVDGDITIADTSRGVKGDSVTVIAVDTKPVTVFIGSTPIGDAPSADIIGRIIAALKVGKS